MNSSGWSFCLTSAFLPSGLRPSHCLLLLLHRAEAASQLCDRLLRDQQSLLPASCGVSINPGAFLGGEGEGRIRKGGLFEVRGDEAVVMTSYDMGLFEVRGGRCQG